MLETLLAMDPVIIASFMGAGILLNLTPGADVMFASACGISGGWKSAVAASFGIALGTVMHLALAAFGVSAAIVALPYGYDIIRYAGAVYLAYLAIKSWRTPINTDDNIAQKSAALSISTAIKRGFITNALNPKVALFILAFLPQFVDQNIGPIWQQIIILGLLFSITGLIISSAYGALAGVFGNTLKRATGTLNKITAIVFGGLAARLVLE